MSRGHKGRCRPWQHKTRVDGMVVVTSPYRMCETHRRTTACNDCRESIRTRTRACPHPPAQPGRTALSPSAPGRRRRCCHHCHHCCHHCHHCCRNAAVDLPQHHAQSQAVQVALAMVAVERRAAPPPRWRQRRHQSRPPLAPPRPPPRARLPSCQTCSRSRRRSACNREAANLTASVTTQVLSRTCIANTSRTP